MELEEWVTVGSGYPAHDLVVPKQVRIKLSWPSSGPVRATSYPMLADITLTYQGMVYTANYGGNSFSGVTMDADGQLGEVEYLENFPGPLETCRYNWGR